MELIVFRSARQARDCGFGENGRHQMRGCEDILAWWPGHGIEALRGMPVVRVTWLGDFREDCIQSPLFAEEIAQARAMLRSRPTMKLWMES